jgi:LmbE family N-acetylglucosaminyl deacetylase
MSLITLAADLPHRLQRILCVGAHADDIEIGCGGTIVSVTRANPSIEVDWIVLSAEGERADEARAGAARVLEATKTARVRIEQFPQRYFPGAFTDLKRYFDALGRDIMPQVVFCPRLEDMHQDHRVVAELVWQTFRSQFVLEYEIAKYEGDLGRPSTFVELSREVADHKIRLLEEVFVSQRERYWFDEEAFRGLLRLRGIESRAASGYAEAFHARKLRLW